VHAGTGVDVIKEAGKTNNTITLLIKNKTYEK
jgi:hypothetical protein